MNIFRYFKVVFFGNMTASEAYKLSGHFAKSKKDQRSREVRLAVMKESKEINRDIAKAVRFGSKSTVYQTQNLPLYDAKLLAQEFEAKGFTVSLNTPREGYFMWISW